MAADTIPVALSVAEHEVATAHVMEERDSDPQRLEIFLRAMPKERVRQLEQRAMHKLRVAMMRRVENRRDLLPPI